MNSLKTILSFALCLFAFSMSMQAQTCSELFQKATSLKNSGKWADAIVFFQRAKDCDPNLKKDCDDAISFCRKKIDSMPVLEVSEQEIIIPYQGGDKMVNVKSSNSWSIDGKTEWCNTDSYDKNNFIIQCREVNNSTRPKSTTLIVKSGSLYQSLKVTQEGRPEYLEVGATSLSFPSKGTEEFINIDSNANWDVTSVPSWCQIERKDDGIHIVVDPNDKIMDRTDKIVIDTPSKSIEIRVYQGAGEEHLTLSHNNILLNSEGDVHYVKVYTDANNWFVGDYPTWMNVQRVGQDSIRIQVGRNLPNSESRSGSVQVRTDRQTAGVMVTQSPRMAVDVIFPNSKLVGGRNFSFGVSASYCMPFVGASAGGDYVGSVVDYGLGTSAENASYKSGVGYSFGVFADMRLYKNIFLIAGVNFTQIKYKNDFNKTTTGIFQFNKYEYLKGDVQNSYKEDYSYSMIEVPILASYRFKIGDVSHVQLNLGPVLNFGLSAKMNLSGNSDSETLKLYNIVTDQPTGSGNYNRHTAVNADFNLYQPCVYWKQTFTSGNDQDVEKHDVFAASPMKKFNCGLRIGAAYEWAGLSFGVYYTYMLTNMANAGYWDNERWTVLNVSEQTMKGYKQHLNTLEFKIAYTLRYINF